MDFQLGLLLITVLLLVTAAATRYILYACSWWSIH